MMVLTICNELCIYIIFFYSQCLVTVEGHAIFMTMLYIAA